MSYNRKPTLRGNRHFNSSKYLTVLWIFTFEQLSSRRVSWERVSVYKPLAFSTLEENLSRFQWKWHPKEELRSPVVSNVKKRRKRCHSSVSLDLLLKKSGTQISERWWYFIQFSRNHFSLKQSHIMLLKSKLKLPLRP